MDNGSSSTGLVDLLAKKMAYLNQRQSVLAENVANVDTPGYKAHDLAPFTFDDALKQTNIGMATTNARHIVPASMAGVNAKTIKVNASETLPDGNSVDIEQEMMKVSQTSVDYQSVAAIYKTVTSLFRIAIKGS